MGIGFFIIALIIALVTSFFVVKTTKFVFRMLLLALLIALLCYLYLSGAQDIFIAPGMPEVIISIM